MVCQNTHMRVYPRAAKPNTFVGRYQFGSAVDPGARNHYHQRNRERYPPLPKLEYYVVLIRPAWTHRTIRMTSRHN